RPELGQGGDVDRAVGADVDAGRHRLAGAKLGVQLLPGQGCEVGHDPREGELACGDIDDVDGVSAGVVDEKRPVTGAGDLVEVRVDVRAVRVVLDLVFAEGCDLRQLARLDGIPPDGVLLRQRHFAGSDPRAADREVDLARAKGNTVHADALAVGREPL